MMAKGRSYEVEKTEEVASETGPGSVDPAEGDVRSRVAKSIAGIDAWLEDLSTHIGHLSAATTGKIAQVRGLLSEVAAAAHESEPPAPVAKEAGE